MSTTTPAITCDGCGRSVLGWFQGNDGLRLCERCAQPTTATHRTTTVNPQHPPIHLIRADMNDGCHYVYLYATPVGKSVRQVEVASGVVVDLDETGQLIGVELLDCPCRDHQ